MKWNLFWNRSLMGMPVSRRIFPTPSAALEEEEWKARPSFYLGFPLRQ